MTTYKTIFLFFHAQPCEFDERDFEISNHKTRAVLKGDSGRVRVVVWNLGENSKTGNVEVSGMRLSGLPPEPFALGPRGSSPVAFDCTLSPADGDPCDGALVLSARFNGRRPSRLYAPLLLEKKFLASLERTPVAWRSAADWKRNTSAQEYRVSWDEKEGAVRFDVSWSDPKTDRWLYPVHDLNLPRESLKGACMIEFEVKSVQDKVENDFSCANLMLCYGESTRPDTKLAYPPPIGVWERRRVRIGEKDNPADVKAIRIGANPKGTKCTFWEIWNEPDLDPSDGELPKNPRCWGGTVTNFFNLYEMAAKHLKGKFPNLKIGGPAICGRFDWGERFLAYCRDNAVPLDFFSWHTYANEPRQIAANVDLVRRLMDKYGFRKSESILNEWNYVKGWIDDWQYSLEVESGRFSQKGAAFVMSTMIDCQSKPVDMLMFYDARTSSNMNNMFSRPTLQPQKGYYPFYAWSKLVGCGTQVACSVREGRGKASDANTGTVFKSENGKPIGSFRAVAGKGADGSGALIVARYSDDNNVADIAEVTISVSGVSLAGGRCHLTDSVRTYTEIPIDLCDDGTASIRMQPNSFAVVEW